MIRARSQQLTLWLVAARLALVSLWREVRSSLIVRSLCIASSYALCAFLIIDGNLRQASWSACVALLGIAALSLVGLALSLRKRRETMAPLLASMPVAPCVWIGCDIIALVIVTLCLSLPFLGFLCLMDVLPPGTAITLMIFQSILVTILFPFGASGKAGAIAWSVIIVVLWAQILNLMKPYFY